MLGANMLSMSALSLYRNLVQFGMSMALTAFISPAQYGLVVFTLPFLVLIAMLTDLGLSSAITRAPTLSREQAGAALTLMATVGTLFALLVAAVAHPLALLIRMQGLGGIMTGMAVVILFTVTAASPRALLERRLQYGRIASIEAAAVFVSAILGLIAAWQGAGAYALVLYNVLSNAMRAVAFVWLTRSEVELNRNWRTLSPLLTFGGWVLANNLLNFVARNSDNLLIGIYLGSAAVGVYGLSYQFMLAPLMAITWPASGILLSTLRTQADDPVSTRRVITGVIAGTALITFPAMLFLTFAISFPIHALLAHRPGWNAVSSIIVWLALPGALQSISSYNGAVLLVAGRARAQFLYTVLNTVVLVATFLIALPFGLMALVKAYAIVVTLLSLMFLSLIVRYSSVTWRDLLAALAPASLATAAGLTVTSLATGLAPVSWFDWFTTAALYGAVVLGSYLLCIRRLRSVLGILMARPA